MKHDRAYWYGIHGCIKAQMKKEGKYKMELQTFSNDQFGTLRTVEIENKIYYCGNDVAKALGYARPKDAVAQHCKGAVKHRTPTNGGIQELSFIPEGDVYRLTARSKLPQAEKFESWVFDEVLPQIAHTGAYKKPASAMDLLALQYQALKEVDGKVIEVRNDLKNHEENHELTRAEYDHLSAKVAIRLKQVKEVREWKLNPKQCGILKHGINGDITRYMGVRTRTMIARKDFEKACQFVEGRDPSSVTLQELLEASDEKD